MHISKQYWRNSLAWSIKSLIFWEIFSHNQHLKWLILQMLNIDIVHLYSPPTTSYSNIRFFCVIISCWVAAKRQRSYWKCCVLNTYHIMHVWMIVFYIEENMQTKRYVWNLGMIGTIIKKKGKSHGPPHSILWYMLIIPRIQRLFHCEELVMLQGWHSSQKSELRVMRIPTYSIVMKHVTSSSHIYPLSLVFLV